MIPVGAKVRVTVEGSVIRTFAETLIIQDEAGNRMSVNLDFIDARIEEKNA